MSGNLVVDHGSPGVDHDERISAADDRHNPL